MQHIQFSQYHIVETLKRELKLIEDSNLKFPNLKPIKFRNHSTNNRYWQMWHNLKLIEQMKPVEFKLHADRATAIEVAKSAKQEELF